MTSDRAGQDREGREMVALTMTPAAAGRFYRALLAAEARTAADPTPTPEWLRWGASRLSSAMHDVGADPNA